MSMFNDINYGNEDNAKVCSENSLLVCAYSESFAKGHWSFLGPASEAVWYNTLKVKPGGKWDEVTEIMSGNFRLSGHPTFRAASALGRGQLTRKGGGRVSVHFRASEPPFSAVYFISSAFTEHLQTYVKNLVIFHFVPTKLERAVFTVPLDSMSSRSMW